MTEREVREVVGQGPVCVRYLYDVHGQVILGGAPAGARVVPASALLSKAARSRFLAAATLAATAIVFEACGGGSGDFSNGSYGDAGTSTTPSQPGASTPGRSAAMPTVGDASDDASDADPDAGGDAGIVDPDGG
jgi:hypothetical protein